ncbi:MAG: ribbon-helix-helix protein, CopG family [Acidimicrobiia bacterium]
MARREVLVQLEDELVARLDEVASRLEVSRSELLRRGAAAVLDADELAQEDKRLADAYKNAPPDAALLESARRIAAETSPEW